jgi:ketopantoate reductase
MELEALRATAVRLGRRHGIEAPLCEAVDALFEPWAIRNRGKEKSPAPD